MALLGPRLAGNVQKGFTGIGNIGSRMPEFAFAIGIGSVISLAGKSYKTSSIGTGAGLGIKGVSAQAISIEIQKAYFSEFETIGDKFPDIADVIGKAIAEEITQANLIGGGGTVVKGSFSVDATEWGENIRKNGPIFLGPDWPRFSLVVGKGCVAAFANATGTIVGPTDSGSKGGIVT
jgi:hypothetical protein